MEPILPPAIPPQPSTLPPPPPKKKSFTWLIILVILLLLATTGALAYQYYQLKTQVASPTASPPLVPSPALTPSQDLTANWKTYNNDKFGFLFTYPSEWKIEAGDNYNERSYGEIYFFMNCSTSTLALSLFDLNRSDAAYKSVDEFLNTAPFLSPLIPWKDIDVAGASGKYYQEVGESGSVTPSVRVVIYNSIKNNIVTLYFTDPCGVGIDKAIKTNLNPLLSTFKFIN